MIKFHTYFVAKRIYLIVFSTKDVEMINILYDTIYFHNDMSNIQEKIFIYFLTDITIEGRSINSKRRFR
jgi:hypothetical protein